MKISNFKFQIRFRWKRFSSSILAFILISTIVIVSLKPKAAHAAWFDDNWAYRKTLTFTHNATVSTASQVEFDIDTTDAPDKFQADCGDVRFTDPSGKLLPYWYDSASGACDTASTDFDVLIPSIINGSNYIYMYYGNPSAVNGTVTSDFSAATTTPSGGAASAGSEEKAPSPVAYWKFDDGTGSTAQDSTTNNLDGTISGAVWRDENQCIAGKCLWFDGSDDNVTKSDDVNLDFAAADSFTVSAWVKHNGAIATNEDYILTKADTTTGGYKLYMDNSGDFCFAIDDDASWTPDDSACTSGVDFDDDQWHRVTGVKNGTTEIKLYVDGKERASDASIAATNTLANGNALYIGVDRDGTSNEWLGFIDDVKIYRYVRSVNQIQAEFVARGGSKGSSVLGSSDQKFLTDGLVAYWKMDETAADSCGSNDTCDYTGNGYHAAWTGNTTSGAAKLGIGTVYDGSGDYATTSSHALLNANVGTISMWVYPTTTAAPQHLFMGGASTADGFGGDQELQVSISGGNFYFSNYATGENWDMTYAIPTANVWYHVVGTWDTTTNMAKMYVNGALVNSDTSIGALNKAGWSNLVRFGASINTSFNQRYFTGREDEVRVYNRALSETDVLKLYQWAPGPVGYWKLDEKSGTSAFDSSGNDNTATLTNAPTWITGKYGAGVNLAGSDAHITRADDSDFDFGTGLGFSYGAWVKHNTASALEMIIDKYDTTAGNGGFKLYMESDGDLTCGIDDDEASFPEDSATSTAATYDDNLWHYIECVKDGTTGLYLYIDGVLIASDTSISSTGDFANADPLYIGIAEDGTSNDWIGQIDDVKIYNYARIARQVVEDMNASHPPGGSPVGSAVAYWKFDAGYATTANDSSSQNGSENLTLSASSNWTTSGKFGKAYNGADNKRASRTDDDDLDFTTSEDFTLSLWFKSDSASNPSANEYLLDKLPSGASNGGYAIYTSSSGGTVCFGIDDDSTSFPEDSTCSSADIYDNTWHHIVGVKTGTSRMDLYVDGRATGTPDTSISASVNTLANTSTFYIGDANGTDGTDEFLGDIDEVKIYRSALSADTVKVDYNRGQSEVMGALSTAASGREAQSASAEYCVPGSSETCTAPVGRWDFEEKTGTTTNDTSGNGTTLTFNGNAKWGQGKTGAGVYYDGVTGTYLDSSAVSTIQTTGDISVGLWLKATTTTNGNFIAGVRGGGETSPDNEMWMLEWDTTSGNDIKYQHEDGAGVNNNMTFDTNLSTNTWYYIAIVRNTTSNTVTLYVNGIKIASTGYTNDPTDGSAATLKIGAAGGGSSSTFNGYIDSLRIYNYQRSQAQIAWDYNRGAPIGWWKMDECQGTSIKDSSGNSITGTITIGATDEDTVGNCTTASTAWGNGASGKRNYSLSFDGDDDHVSFGDVDSLDMADGQDFSIAGWFKTNAIGSIQTIIGKKNGVGGTAQGYTIRIVAIGKINFVINDGLAGNSFTLPSETTFVANTWYHFVVVVDDDSEADTKIYINGIDEKATSGDDLSLVGSLGNSVIFRIGQSQNLNYFDGLLDDLRIYNYALTYEQARRVYNGGAVNFAPVTGTP